MLLTALLACSQDTVTETHMKRVSMASKEPIPVACTPAPTWERVASQVSADSASTGRITLDGALTDSACDVQLELRDAAAVRLLGVTVPATRGPGSTSSSSGTVEGPVGTLELWVAATGPTGASATYTYKVEVVETETMSR